MNYKRYGFVLFFLFISSIPGHAQTPKGTSIQSTVLKHRQLYSMSCIPSSVEMILKFNNKTNANFYDLQHQWKDKSDGTFANFDGKTIKGITFTHRFKENRSANFPIDRLFKTIDTELKAGRKVIVSLLSGPGLWHMYVIDGTTKDGDYICYSRSHNNNEVLEIRNTKQRIRAMHGTDILTYRVN